MKKFFILHNAQVLYLTEPVITVKRPSRPVKSQATSAIASKMQDWEVSGHFLLGPLMDAFLFPYLTFSPGNRDYSTSYKDCRELEQCKKASVGSF